MAEPDVLDRIPAAIVRFTDDGLITYLNATLVSMFGYKAEELIGSHFEVLLTKPSRIFYQTHLFPLLKVQGKLEEIYLIGADKEGAHLSLLINGTRITSEKGSINECVLVRMTLRDEYEEALLTAKRAAEAANEEKALAYTELSKVHATLGTQQDELHRQNEELEQLRKSLEFSVAERTSQLQEALRELQGLTYSMAHELRTPVRELLSANSLLLQEPQSALTAEQVRLLASQRQSGLNLIKLIDDLLKYYRLRDARISQKEFDISKLARSVTANMHCVQSVHQFEIEDGITITADPKLVESVLERLFANAVLYSPEGGVIKFGRCEVGSQKLLCIADQGIGIDQAYIQRIFKPLERLHREEEFPGNGMGLAIAERIVERHGGKIFVESEPGVGTHVYFCFRQM